MTKKKVKEYFAAGDLRYVVDADIAVSVFSSLEAMIKEKYDEDQLFKLVPIKVVGKFTYVEDK